MGKIDNLKANELRGVTRQLKRQGTTAPLGSTSVHNGRTRFVGLLSLLVEGSALVSGLLTISGTLRGVGSLLWDSIVTFTGTFTSTGPTNLNGDTVISKTLDVGAATTLRGPLSLLANMVVSEAGEIRVEGTVPVVLGPTANGPGLRWSTGATLSGSALGAALTAGTMSVSVNTAGAAMRAGTTRSVVVTSTGTTVAGPAQLSTLSVAPTGTTVYMVVADASGNLYRKSTAA